jgi:hypothetical protein
VSKLDNLYSRILNRIPFTSRSHFRDVYSYEILNEEAPTVVYPDGFQYIEATGTISSSWDQLQASLFDRQNEGSGRGEYSVAALLISKLDPVKYNEFIQAGVDGPGAIGTINAAKYIDDFGIVQGGSVSYDVNYPNTDLKYEVKEIGEGKGEARTGTEGKRAAKALLDKIHSGINNLYEKYTVLDPQSKEIVNQFKTPSGLTIGSILQTAHKYFGIKTGELPMGAVFSREKKVKVVKNPRKKPTPEPEPVSSEESISVPKLSFLADLIFELVMDPRIEEIIPQTAEQIKNIYKTNDFEARFIDAYIRNYLKDIATNDPKVKLSDFILYCSVSIFRNDAAFKKEVQDYFTPGTEQHKRAVKEALPVTGVFAVDPGRFYYTGANELEKGIRVTRISMGGFKIGKAEEA